MEIHHFFVPHRLVWEDFQHFMGEKIDPDDSTVYVVPTVPTTAVTGEVAGSLMDYLGVPIGVAGKSVNALYTRSYNKIFNDWYRDQNLMDLAVVDVDAGPDVATDYPVRKRCKYHDYFTSCLPGRKKGLRLNYLLALLPLFSELVLELTLSLRVIRLLMKPMGLPR